MNRPASSYVTDLSRLDRSDSITEPFFAIVEAATSRRCEGRWSSAVDCFRRAGRGHCRGLLEVWRNDLEAFVGWVCPACGTNGRITGWKGSVADLSSFRTSASSGEEMESPEIPLSPAELKLARSLEAVGREVDRLLASARGAVLNGKGVCFIQGSDDDLEDLANSLAAESNATSNSRREAALTRLMDSIEEASGL